jgi:hypothetical protein
MPQVIEMRTYKTKPGKRDEWLDVFIRKSIPEHDRLGMRIVGPFLSVEDPDTFFWMRIFPDLESREGLKRQFYDGELWHAELEAALLPNLEKYEAVVVEDRDGLIPMNANSIKA